MDPDTVTSPAAHAHIDWWSGFGGAVLGAVLGALIGSCVPYWLAAAKRRRERRGEIDAMEIEVMLTHLQLRQLLKADDQAPLYHLPVSMCQQVLPKLLGDGLLSIDEAGALIEYVNKVEELNRGLERARQASNDSNGAPMLTPEFLRNKAKATEMLDQPSERWTGQSLLDAAEAVLFRLEDMHKDPWWVYWFGRIRHRAD